MSAQETEQQQCTLCWSRRKRYVERHTNVKERHRTSNKKPGPTRQFSRRPRRPKKKEQVHLEKKVVFRVLQKPNVAAYSGADHRCSRAVVDRTFRGGAKDRVSRQNRAAEFGAFADFPFLQVVEELVFKVVSQSVV